MKAGYAGHLLVATQQLPLVPATVPTSPIGKDTSPL